MCRFLSRHKCLQCRGPGFDPWFGKIPGERDGYPLQYSFFFFTPVFLAGEFHGQRSLAGYSPQGRRELDLTEQLSTAQQKVYVPLKVNSYLSLHSCQFSANVLGEGPTDICEGSPRPVELHLLFAYMPML